MCVCVGVLAAASVGSLPVVWQQSSVRIILVTVVAGKNSVTVSGQLVLGEQSVGLGRLIPVQLHRCRVHHHMSGLGPNSWSKERER